MTRFSFLEGGLRRRRAAAPALVLALACASAPRGAQPAVPQVAVTAAPQGAVPAAAQGTQAPAPALLLANEFRAGLDVSRYLVSEKFDGVPAIWDGKTLRFRGGREVAAPGWFKARLPATPLDGELWLARGKFDELSRPWCARRNRWMRNGAASTT